MDSQPLCHAEKLRLKLIYLFPRVEVVGALTQHFHVFVQVLTVVVGVVLGDENITAALSKLERLNFLLLYFNYFFIIILLH